MAIVEPVIHPFFCSSSPYRLRTQGGMWADGGEETVRQFFERMRRRELRSQWQYARPEQPQDWLNEKDEAAVKANQAIHDYLTAEDATVPQERVYEPARGGPAGYQPLCFTYELSGNQAQQIGAPRAGPPNSLFPGLGQPVLPAATRFPVAIPSDHSGAHCLALFLDESMLLRLGELLELRKEEVTRAKAADVLLKALDPAVLRIDPERPAQAREKARRLQRAWSCLPGLVGATGEDGFFRVKLELARAKQIELSDWVGVVFCVEPKTEAGAETGT